MDEQSIINQRILEVRASNEALRAKIAENDTELAELEAAADTVARLMRGKSKASIVNVKRKDNPSRAKAKRDGLPSMPELIIMALKHEKRPMEPREITEVIRRYWWPEVESKKIGSIVWRLNSRNDIQKVEGTSTYRLPTKEEAPDENPGRNTSEASLFTADPEAQGVKAAPGGGP